MRLIIFTLLIQTLSISCYYSQNNGLLKKETITTFWGENEKQIRSVGTYQTSGYSNIGAKTGKWIHFYKNGNLQEESNYYLGQLNGEYKTYYLNGKLKIRTFYTLGKIDSIFEAFYQDGTFAENGKYNILPKINRKDTTAINYWFKRNEEIDPYKSDFWEYYYENGKLMEKSYFKDGSDTTEYIDEFYESSGDTLIWKGEGNRKTYYSSSKLKTIVKYKNGLKNGDFKLFKPNGHIRKTGTYINGEMSGKWRELYLSTDTIYQDLEYKNGLKNGLFKEYYVNGKISMNGNYTNDLKNGDWTYSFINGAFDMKGAFKNDKQNGFWTFYYPKGIEYYKGNFINGQKDGKWDFFYNTGKIWKKGEYKYDQKNGFWTTKFENGTTAMEGNYVMNKENGIWKSWYDNGQLKDNGSFNLGKMDNKWVGYYTNGQMKYSGEYEDDYKINSWVYYSVKGEIIETRNYKVLNTRSMLIPNENRMVKKSVADGKWMKYSEYDQSIKSEENYSEGKLNGKCSYYFPGGIIPNRIVNYNNGLLEGNYQNFTRKGNIISETNYKNNRKHGDVKIYSKRGKLISHIVYKDGIKVKDVINKINFKYNSPTKKK